MFISTNVQALFKKGTLKLAPNDDGEMRRVAEVQCVIDPFPHALARELGEDIAGHLFTDDGAIRDELESVDLFVRAGLQRVTVRHHEELDQVATLSPVSVKDVSVARNEDKHGRAWLSFTFVMVFSLEEKAARNFVLDKFGLRLLWTFQHLQLLLEEDVARTQTDRIANAKAARHDMRQSDAWKPN